MVARRELRFAGEKRLLVELITHSPNVVGVRIKREVQMPEESQGRAVHPKTTTREFHRRHAASW